jgi:WD40 repeat protein
MMQMKGAKKLHLFSGHSGPVYALRYLPESRLLFSCSGDGTVACHDLTFSRPSFVFLRSQSPLYAFALSETLALAGNYNGVVHLANPIEKKEVKALSLHRGPVFSLLLSSLHPLWLSGGNDGTLHLMENAGNVLRRVQAGTGKIRSLQFNANETEVLLACGDGFLRVYSFPELQLMNTLQANDSSCNAALFNPFKKNHFITGGRDAHLLHLQAGSEEFLQKIPAHYFAIYALLAHPPDQLLLSASRDKSIKAWNLQDLSFLYKLDEQAGGHTRSVNTLAWVEPGKTFASAGDDKQIILWELIRS